MTGSNLPNDLPPEIKEMIGKTIQRKLPDGRVIKFLIGDITGDGKIDKEDIEILRMLCQGGPTSEKLFSSLSPEQVAACDITGDGYINRDDLLQLAKKMLNQDPKRNIENKLSNLRNKLKD